MPTATQLLTRAVSSDPAKPRLTWYDDGTSARIELSGASLVNWVNKTANFLSLELGTQPGDQVTVDLPRHWLLAVWWLAIDAVGAQLVVAPTEPPAVAVVGPERLDDLPPADEIVAVSLQPLGAAFDRALPSLVHDFGAQVRQQPDQFSASAAGNQRDGSQAVAQAGSWQLQPADRVLEWQPVPTGAPTMGLLAALAADASVVWVHRLKAARLVELVTAERVTAALGWPPTGIEFPASIRLLPEGSLS